MEKPHSQLASERLKDVRVLVVEDEVLIAMEVQVNLEDAGAHVVGPAHTVAAALDRVRTDAGISAAILDIRLGGTTVGAVARLLAERRIPFVFYTGQTANDPVCLEWPDAAVISKPAGAYVLVDAVARLLRASTPRDVSINAAVRANRS